jgi:hypothetical protein
MFMSELPDFIDDELWITLLGEPGKKYFLFYNPHTHKGRMGVWDPDTQQVFRVSKNEIASYSHEASYWVKGFLAGNEPDPPKSRKGYDLPDNHPKLIRWRKAIELFHESGFWFPEVRKCTQCGKELLPSQLGLVCPECKGTN